MSVPSLEDVRASGPVERLLEESWSAREDGAGKRELIVEGLAGLLFLACAIPLAASALAHRDTDPLLAGALVVLYAISSRLVKFAIGAGYVVPSYLVLVPMLLLLPPGLAPLLACAGLALGSAAQWAAGQVRAERIALSVPDAWHTLGPAVVLLAAGRHPSCRPRWSISAPSAPAACSTWSRQRCARPPSPASPRGYSLRVLALVWLIDACIAPLGLLVAHAARSDHAQVLLILPLNAAMLIASRDRNSRIEQAQRRLEAVAHERTRLQTAVRRLGEALAARLDLSEMTGIVLRSSIEALDADGGRLALEGPGAPAEMEIGCQRTRCHAFAARPTWPARAAGRFSSSAAGTWALALPFRSPAGPGGSTERSR